jgi:hypothetical protein
MSSLTLAFSVHMVNVQYRWATETPANPAGYFYDTTHDLNRVFVCARHAAGQRIEYDYAGQDLRFSIHLSDQSVHRPLIQQHDRFGYNDDFTSSTPSLATIKSIS